MLPDVAEDRPLLVMRRGSMLVPVAPIDSDAIMELPAGKPLRCELKQPRNVQRLRLYWAMIGLIVENLDGNIDRGAMHDAIKIRLGYFAVVPFKSGPEKVPASIAFDKMTEAEFAAFLDAFKALVRDQIIPGIGKAAFERQALEMLGEAA